MESRGMNPAALSKRGGGMNRAARGAGVLKVRTPSIPWLKTFCRTRCSGCFFRSEDREGLTHMLTQGHFIGEQCSRGIRVVSVTLARVSFPLCCVIFTVCRSKKDIGATKAATVSISCPPIGNSNFYRQNKCLKEEINVLN